MCLEKGFYYRVVKRRVCYEWRGVYKEDVNRIYTIFNVYIIFLWYIYTVQSYSVCVPYDKASIH